jgi:hypothetical protein
VSIPLRYVRVDGISEESPFGKPRAQ